MKHFVAVCLIACSLAPLAHAANWSVTRINHMVLTPPGGVTVQELSGVSYIGPSAGGHRFIAAEETKGELVFFDLTFDANGAITGISGVTPRTTTITRDYEGIAYTNPARNSVFLADETNAAGPSVREFNLTSGGQQQVVSIPAVFGANKRANLGFESLARSPDGTVMWTANEQALTVDGDVSTPSTGTTVRLLRFGVAGNTVTAGQQFAYQVEPIHGTSTLGSPQSGLSDLVLMPDDTLFALERSVAVTTPIYLNRIYEVGFAGATDVSVGALGSGLIGQSFTPVTKQLLFSGAADAASGQNLEGIALGPRLANGSYVLVGVVDNGAGTDPLSMNTIVSFTATANPSADFDKDGDEDGADFLAWQRGFGKTIGAQLAEGDADRDGDVDGADFTEWKRAFADAETASPVVPEPASALLVLIAVGPALFWLKADS